MHLNVHTFDYFNAHLFNMMWFSIKGDLISQHILRIDTQELWWEPCACSLNLSLLKVTTITKTTIISVPWVIGWTNHWRRKRGRRWVLKENVRVSAGFFGIFHLIINLSTWFKRYNCIHLSQILTSVGFRRRRWCMALGFTFGRLGSVPGSPLDDTN